MHPDPKQGVVDVNCRVHGVGNLFVAGDVTLTDDERTRMLDSVEAIATAVMAMAAVIDGIDGDAAPDPP